MNILWAGGEDADFQLWGGATSIDTTAGRFRSGWARCTIQSNQLQSNSQGFPQTRSAPFQGGAVTNCWYTFRGYFNNGGGANFNNNNCVALGKSGNFGYLTIGISGSQFQIVKLDASTGTRTVLATESGSDFAMNTLYRFDIQVSNYGASGTVTVYVNGTVIMTFTGNIAVTGITNLDTVIIPSTTGTNAGSFYSEIIVADSDTRSIQGLATLALTGAGTTTGWSNNTFSNINGTSESDNNPTNVNTAAVDQQYTVTNINTAIPSFAVLACKITARAARTSSSTPTNVKLGYGSAGSGFFGSGASKAITSNIGYTVYEQYDTINPITSAAFTPTDMSTLQLDLESA